MTARAVRGIVFDLEGTLLRSEEAVRRGFDHAMGARASAIAWSRLDLRDPLVAVLGQRGDLAAFLDGMADSATAPPADIVDLLDRLRGKYRLAVATNARADVADALLSATGLIEYFETVVRIDEVRVGKPDPESIHLACARLGIRAADAIVVGDTPSDVIAARRAGARGVLATWWGGPSADCDVEVDSPAALLAWLDGARGAAA